MRLLVKQNAAWAERLSERELARERVKAILQRRRQHLKVGYVDEDGPVDFESQVPYDAFVQDPFRDDEVMADMAY
jgi:hypothetical protein